MTWANVWFCTHKTCLVGLLVCLPSWAYPYTMLICGGWLGQMGIFFVECHTCFVSCSPPMRRSSRKQPWWETCFWGTCARRHSCASGQRRRWRSCRWVWFLLCSAHVWCAVPSAVWVWHWLPFCPQAGATSRGKVGALIFFLHQLDMRLMLQGLHMHCLHFTLCSFFW